MTGRAAVALVALINAGVSPSSPTVAACEDFVARVDNQLEASRQGRSQAEATLVELREREGSPEYQLAQLRLREYQLEQRGLEAQAAIAELACNQHFDDPWERRQRIAEQVRITRQALCHRDGKRLAAAETSLAGSPSGRDDLEAAIARYRPIIEACMASGVAAAEVRFPSADGGITHGRLHGYGRRGLVLSHGGRSTKESWRDQAQYLAERGFRVLSIDFRGRGRSLGPNGATGGAEYEDVLGAVRYLRQTGSDTVAVLGASFGGGAAATAAVKAEPGTIGHLILMAHSPIEHPEQIQGCKLFVVARDDRRGGGVRRIDATREQYERAAEPKTWLELDGGAHAQALFGTEQGGRLLVALTEFLQQPCEP